MRALSKEDGAFRPGRTGRGIGLIVTPGWAPSSAAREFGLFVLGRSKCSSGRPRGGREGRQEGVASAAGFRGSTTVDAFASFVMSSLRGEPPFFGAMAGRPSAASAASKVKSTTACSTLLAEDEGANCWDSALPGCGGL
jgi:hypothetical protein